MLKKRRKARKLATLTVEEDKAWEAAFTSHVNDGMSDAQADRLAWKHVQAEFERLLAFDGCER
jgi:hypothetical protein